MTDISSIKLRNWNETIIEEMRYHCNISYNNTTPVKFNPQFRGSCIFIHSVDLQTLFNYAQLSLCSNFTRVCDTWMWICESPFDKPPHCSNIILRTSLNPVSWLDDITLGEGTCSLSSLWQDSVANASSCSSSPAHCCSSALEIRSIFKI